jgi:hypothetical protein
MRPDSLQSSPRTITFVAATLVDLDAVKTSVATAATPITYSGAGFNGALGAGPITLDPPRYISVTNTSAVGTYKYGASYPIVITGTRCGVAVTESLLLTTANGNETIVGDQPFDTLVSIAIPAQNDTSGAWTFGVHGLACRATGGESPQIHPYRRIKANVSGGNAKIGFGGSYTDILPLVVGSVEEVLVSRVYGTSDTTVGGLTVYE